MRGPRRSSRRWRGDGSDFPPSGWLSCDLFPVACHGRSPPYRSGAGPGSAGPGAGGRRRGSPEAWRGDAGPGRPAAPGWPRLAGCVRGRAGPRAGCRCRPAQAGTLVRARSGADAGAGAGADAAVGAGTAAGPGVGTGLVSFRQSGPSAADAYLLGVERLGEDGGGAGGGVQGAQAQGGGGQGLALRGDGARRAGQRAGVPGDDQRVDRPSAVQAQADELVQGAVGPGGERPRGQPRGDVAPSGGVEHQVGEHLLLQGVRG